MVSCFNINSSCFNIIVRLLTISQIHYIERMGRDSPYSQGSCTTPTLKEWDTTKELKNLDGILKHCGFGAGITSGFALRPKIDLEKPVSLLPMEADECKIEKVCLYIITVLWKLMSVQLKAQNAHISITIYSQNHKNAH